MQSCQRRRRVGDVVTAGDREPHRHLTGRAAQREPGSPLPRLDRLGPELGCLAIVAAIVAGNRVAKAAAEPRQRRSGRADRRTGLGAEALERLPELGLSGPVRVVIELDVGDQGDVGVEAENCPSLSSASATTTPPVPQPALAGAPAGPAPGSSPPSTKTGSAPVARRAWAIMPEVVVLPCAPATAIRLPAAAVSSASSPMLPQRRAC